MPGTTVIGTGRRALGSVGPRRYKRRRALSIARLAAEEDRADREQRPDDRRRAVDRGRRDGASVLDSVSQPARVRAGRGPRAGGCGLPGRGRAVVRRRRRRLRRSSRPLHGGRDPRLARGAPQTSRHGISHPRAWARPRGVRARPGAGGREQHRVAAPGPGAPHVRSSLGVGCFLGGHKRPHGTARAAGAGAGRPGLARYVRGGEGLLQPVPARYERESGRARADHHRAGRRNRCRPAERRGGDRRPRTVCPAALLARPRPIRPAHAQAQPRAPDAGRTRRPRADLHVRRVLVSRPVRRDADACAVLATPALRHALDAIERVARKLGQKRRLYRARHVGTLHPEE